MKKRNTETTQEEIHWVVGLDVSDQHSTVCRMAWTSGKIVERTEIATTPAGLAAYFRGRQHCRITLEVGTHSPWMSRLLAGYGHEVLVADPTEVRPSRLRRKSDQSDAEGLARLAKADPTLLHPIEHRSVEAQQHLALIRSRHGLVRARTALINLCRGQVKSIGQRLPKCSTESFPAGTNEALPDALRPALEPVLQSIAELTRQIRQMERQVKKLARERYPETERLQQIQGVGPLTAMAFVLTLDDPHRFARPRQVGAYLGLTPGRSQSGERDPGLSITKQGDALLRQYLIQAGHYILGPFGPDCDLRRFGRRLIARGGARAKKRATVAVARRLAVLLLHLWRSGDDYDPFFVEKRQTGKAA